MRVRYSAPLESPEGATLATWKHEVEEESVDKLTAHIASDIVKYLKKGFEWDPARTKRSTKWRPATQLGSS